MRQKQHDLLSSLSSKKTVTIYELEKEYNRLKKSIPFFEAAIDSSLRELRLKKLAETAANIIANARNNSNTAKKKVEKTAEEVVHERWRKARKRGNEFSKQAIRQFYHAAGQDRLDMSFGRVPMKMSQQTEEDLIRERWRYARERGNQFSKLAKQTISLDRKDSDQEFTNMIYTSMKKELYGNYYNARNKLVYKDSIQEYDKEFHLLLLKCAVFEKEHDEVRGFLQGRIFGGSWCSLTMNSFAPMPDFSKIVAPILKSPITQVKAKKSAASIVLKEVSSEPHFKEVGVQVSDGSISKSSDTWCEAKSLSDNISQEGIVFEDVKKPSEERLQFGEIERISEGKIVFEDAAKLSDEQLALGNIDKILEEKEDELANKSSKDDLSFGDVNLYDSFEKIDRVDKIGDQP